MRINIDYNLIQTKSPVEIATIVSNIKNVFEEIHTLKGWRFPLSNLRVSLDLHESHQNNAKSETLWVNLVWAAGTGSSASPESNREIFVSKATKNRPEHLQNVYTYHSYDDLISHFERGVLHEIIK
jgi:hypothetical protein